MYGVTTNYEDLKPMLCGIVHKFRAKYPWMGTFDELLAEANYQFMEAYKRFDRDIGELSTWVHFRVSHCLLEKVRSDTRKAANRPKRVDVVFDELPTTPSFDLDEFVSSLSDDACTVVKIAVNMSPHIRVPRLKLSLARNLKELGWSVTRMFLSFREIEEALK